MRKLTFLVMVAMLAVPRAGWAAAASWLDPNGQAHRAIGDGQVRTWTEPTTNDSAVLVVSTIVECDNTHATGDFTVYASDPAGTKLYVYWGPVVHGASCAPAAGTDTCGRVELTPGWYVFDPDGSGASARCVGITNSTP